jgi:hypothetical protein
MGDERGCACGYGCRDVCADDEAAGWTNCGSTYGDISGRNTTGGDTTDDNTSKNGTSGGGTQSG